MTKSSSKIRDEIARLQLQLKQSEARHAERIGRIALKAGLADLEIDDGDLQAAFEDLSKQFNDGRSGSHDRTRMVGEGGSNPLKTPPVVPDASEGPNKEA